MPHHPQATGQPGFDPAAFALDEFLTLQANSGRAVDLGRVSYDDANNRLRAWLAMACLLGADHPVITQVMESEELIFSSGQGRDDATRRLVAADELARDAQRRAVIGKAITAAANRLTTPENVDRWSALIRVANALGYLARPLARAEGASA